MTFYDNHDMTRIDADQNGFINANNWLFTSRGIPVVYYGSEVGFRAGADQHAGNRDYFGQENVERAKSHPIHAALSRIAAIRKNSIALQRGLQFNLDFSQNTAAFYRVYQKGGLNQTALVLLNKGDATATFEVTKGLSNGLWRDANSGEVFAIDAELPKIVVAVPAHGVRVMLFDAPINNAVFIGEMSQLQMGSARR